MGRALSAQARCSASSGSPRARSVRTRSANGFAERLDNWKTAADYQLWHALATIASGLIAVRWASGSAAAAGWCFVRGVVVFSGSLYALALTDRRKLGAITPIGGVLFLAGWAFLGVVAAIRG